MTGTWLVLPGTGVRQEAERTGGCLPPEEGHLRCQLLQFSEDHRLRHLVELGPAPPLPFTSFVTWSRSLYLSAKFSHRPNGAHGVDL